MSPLTPSSKCRFEFLHNKIDAVDTVIRHTDILQQQFGISVSTLVAGASIPRLPPAGHFKYDDQFPSYCSAVTNGEQVTVAVANKAGTVIAFGLAEVPDGNEIRIDIINVASAFQRSSSSGIKTTLQIEGQTFEVGVAHVLVLHLMRTLTQHVLVTDAATESSRYVFKSLGFETIETGDLCLLTKRQV